MLTLYDYFEQAGTGRHQKSAFYFGTGELMKKLGFDDPLEVEQAIQRAVKACRSLNIPIERNFERIYSYNGREVITEWNLSRLACYLVIINSNPDNAKVAEAQLYLITRNQ